ncbi:MAG: extracellular solute-binding protein, partial [Thioalkalivibrio sp.]|nr:extracellular solute-binding protein [Thioalkalivibrio sp.]
MKPRRLSWFISATAALAVSMPVMSSSVVADEEVNLYSARQEPLIQPLLEDFTDATGIEVKLLTGKADSLLQRLRQEGRNSPADVFITVDAGRLHQAQQAGVLQPVESEVLDENIPARYRHPEGEWFGLSLRARTIMYHKDRVDPDELSTYEALTDSKWEDR